VRKCTAPRDRWRGYPRYEEWSPVGAVQTGDIGEIASPPVSSMGEEKTSPERRFIEAPLPWSSGESRDRIRRDEVTQSPGRTLARQMGDEGGRGEVNLAGWATWCMVVSMSKVSRNLAK